MDIVCAFKRKMESESHEYKMLLYARIGFCSELKEALDFKPDLNASEENTGYTAIALAAKHGHVDCIKALLAAGADINASVNSRHQYGTTTPLLLAIHEMRTDAVSCLLSHAATVDRDHRSELHLAAEKYAQSGTSEEQDEYFKIIQNLVHNGAKRHLDKSVLLVCNQDEHCVNVIKFLIDSGANYTLSPGKPNSLMQYAKDYQNKALIDYLESLNQNNILNHYIRSNGNADCAMVF